MPRIINLFALLLFTLLCCFNAAARDLPLDRIKLPTGFVISIYADDVPGARSMTLGADGTLFVGTFREGKVYAVTKDRKVHTIAEGLNAPNGVALFVVLISLALMSAIVTDLGSNEIVRYRQASNDRDAMKAQALADSAVNLSRLLLAMQAAVNPCITQLDAMGIPLPAHTFWQLVPLDSELLKGVTSGELQGAFGLDVSAALEERKTKLAEQQVEKLIDYDADAPGASKEPFTAP